MNITHAVQGYWSPLSNSDTDVHQDQIILPSYVQTDKLNWALSYFTPGANLLARDWTTVPTLDLSPTGVYTNGGLLLVTYQYNTVPSGHGLLATAAFQLVFTDEVNPNTGYEIAVVL